MTVVGWTCNVECCSGHWITSKVHFIMARGFLVGNCTIGVREYFRKADKEIMPGVVSLE